MDWLPTLLAAAGASEPHPAFPPDGIDLLPVLATNAATIARKALLALTRRMLSAPHATAILQIPQDPRTILSCSMWRKIPWSGQANLKERHKDIYQRLEAEWLAWNRNHVAGDRRKLHAQF